MSLMDVDSVRHGQVRLRLFALVVNCIATQNELLSTSIITLWKECQIKMSALSHCVKHHK